MDLTEISYRYNLKELTNKIINLSVDIKVLKRDCFSLVDKLNVICRLEIVLQKLKYEYLEYIRIEDGQ